MWQSEGIEKRGSCFFTRELLLSVGMRMAGRQERSKDPAEMQERGSTARAKPPAVGGGRHSRLELVPLPLLILASSAPSSQF